MSKMNWAMGDLRDLYIASGVAAALAQYLGAPNSVVPMVGASGAIAEVMGTTCCSFPKRGDIWIILVIFFRIFPVPAWVCWGCGLRCN